MIIDEYVDDDTSGSKSRGAKTRWAQMLRDYDAGLFDALIVTEASRLTRALTDVLDVRPPRRDMRVVAIREGVDTVGGDDYLLKQLVLLAEREVWVKTQRSKRYSLDRRKATRRPAGHPMDTDGSMRQTVTTAARASRSTPTRPRWFGGFSPSSSQALLSARLPTTSPRTDMRPARAADGTRPRSGAC